MLYYCHDSITALRFIRSPLATVIQPWQLPRIAPITNHSIQSIASQRVLETRRLHENVSAVSLSDEVQSSTPLSNGSLDEQNPQDSLRGDQKFAGGDIRRSFRKVVPRYNTNTPKQRSQATRLSIYRNSKGFFNQLLKDHGGSWSYDWRVPLKDLEEHWAPDVAESRILSCKVRNIPHNLRADEIKRPTVWTKTSFHEHVVILTRSTVDRLVARQLYSKDERHIDAVADVLEDLFADHTLKYVFSKEAANCALKFFYKIGKFARGRDLFSKLQELQKNTNPSTYNIMLEAAAKQRDLHTFTSILKMMISHGIHPNPDSWLHLARAVQSDEVRVVVINKLIEKSATQDPVIRRKATAIIFPHVASNFLESNSDPEFLLQALDSRLGPEWFFGPTCQYILDEIGIHHSTQQALAVLKKMYVRGYEPTQGMLLLLLRQCSWTRAHELAIEILRLFRTEYNVNPSRQIYDVLFEQTWRSRFYNCCRVLWVHACIGGCTSFNMQMKMKESLETERSQHYVSQSRSRFWEESAGKVIAGCDRDFNDPNFWDLLSMWKPSDKGQNSRDSFLRKVRSMLTSDLVAFKQSNISAPLDELLPEALRVDQLWASGRALSEVPVECKYSQIIDVGLRPGNTNLAPSNTPLHPSDGASQTKPQEEDNATSSDPCWMSSEMRQRPCTCPAYVKERLRTRSYMAGSEEEHEEQVIPSAATVHDPVLYSEA